MISTASEVALWEKLVGAVEVATLPVARTYSYRLIAQIALMGLAILLSVIYLVLLVIDNRRTSAKFWLCRLQPTPMLAGHGRRLLLNSRIVYPLLTIFVASCKIAAKDAAWKTYIGGLPAQSVAMKLVFPLPFILVQIWISSFNNLHATLSAGRRLRSMSGTLGKAWTHNLSLVAYPVIVFVVALVPAGLWNTAENARQGGLTQLQAEIEGYVAEGTIPTFSQLTPLLLQGERLLSLGHATEHFRRVTSGFMLGLSIPLFLMNLYSLLLVMELRRQARQTIGPANFYVSDDTKSPKSDVNFDPSEGFYNGQANTIALNRLASDLSVAIPTTLFGILAGGTTVIMECLRTPTSSPVITELAADGITYIYGSMAVLVTIGFIVSLIRSWIAAKQSGHSNDQMLDGNRQPSFVVSLGVTGRDLTDEKENEESSSV